MRELAEEIAKALVEHPESVQVREVEGAHGATLELQVDPADLGRVIGKQGRTARSIRSVLHAAGEKAHRRYNLEILE